jgi:hypothetical protein
MTGESWGLGKNKEAWLILVPNQCFAKDVDLGHFLEV